MELKLARFDVDRVTFGSTTEIRDSMLIVDREALRSHLLHDPNFSDMEIQLVSPGEATRIINVLDIVDPRKKVSDTEEVFPGFTGPVNGSGEGWTNVINNVAVIETAQIEGLYGGIIDMAGTASRYSPYSKMHSIVLIPSPISGVSTVEYAHSLKRALLKTSVYLGRTTLLLDPQGVDRFDLAPVLSSKKEERLPRVGYIWQVLSHYALRRMYHCGSGLYNFYPFVLDPQSVIDGALISGHYDHSPGLKNYTFSMLRNPVLMELCRRHGKELDFVGIIVTNAPVSIEEKAWNAALNARLARRTLSCDGVVVTKEGGGHCDFDVMRTCRECEQAGIKTTLIDLEMLGPEGEGDYPLVVFEKEADAIVSVGNSEERFAIPKMEKVVGGTSMKELGADASAANKVPTWLVAGAISELGMSTLRGEWY